MAKTETSSFGTGRREGHDASAFYKRNLYNGMFPELARTTSGDTDMPLEGDWFNQIYCQSAETMSMIPADSVGLAFTSPPYNVGKDYEADISLTDYLGLIKRVGQEIHRVLRPGGRYVINIANLGRKPYIPLHSFFYQLHLELGFLPMGEIIWQKAVGASSSCAWGSWLSAKAPRLRDIHEYLLVFAKQDFSRPDKGESDIARNEFLESTLSIWQIPPESARRVGHPAPFPVELAERVLKLYSYRGDVVLDPFAGSGSTCVAAATNQRHYVGFDISEKYCDLARSRIAEENVIIATSEKKAGVTSSLRAKTECSELSVGFGLLNLAAMFELSDKQREQYFGQTLSAEKYNGFKNEFHHQKNQALYQQLFEVGTKLRQTYPLFETVETVQWCGPLRQAATTSAAKDLLVANTPISVKANSNLVLNASPFNLFQAIPLGQVPAQRAENWYLELAQTELQYLYSLLWDYGLQQEANINHLSRDIVEFEQDASKSDRRTLQAIIKQLTDDAKPKFNQTYVAMCHAVAQKSAAIFNQNLNQSLAGSAKHGVLEHLVKYFFRLDTTEYILAGLDGKQAFAVIMPELTQWKQQWRIKSVQAEANLRRKQSVVNIYVAYEHKKQRLSHTAKFHVEIRWSHGKFCGAPEAKLYKDFLWHKIEFLERLV